MTDELDRLEAQLAYEAFKDCEKCADCPRRDLHHKQPGACPFISKLQAWRMAGGCSVVER